LWRQILTHKNKENNEILLKDWNSYLENIYKYFIVMENIPSNSTKDEYFSIEDIKFRVT
jgi:hypothetical protein